MIKNMKNFKKLNIKSKLLLILEIAIKLALTGILISYLVVNIKVFTGSFVEAFKGGSFFGKFADFVPERTLKERLVYFFSDEHLVLLFNEVLIPLLFNLILVFPVLFYFIIFYKKTVYKERLFNSETEKLNYERKLRVKLSRWILKVFFFVYDLVFRVPLKVVIYYFKREDEFGNKKYKYELKYLILAFLFVRGDIFLILSDFIKMFVHSITFLFKDSTSFIVLLNNSWNFLNYVFYSIVEKLNIIRTIILIVILYVLISISIGNRSIKKAFEKIRKTANSISSYMIAFIGIPGFGKTSTNVAIAREIEKDNWEIMLDYKKTIEIEFSKIVNFKELEDSILKAYKVGLIKNIDKMIDFTKNNVIKNYGKDVLDFDYQDHLPHGKKLDKEIELYAIAIYQLLQETIIVSNTPIEGNGLNDYRSFFLDKYGPEKWKNISSKIIMSKKLNMDNFRDIDSSVSNKVVRSINPGDVIVITEADKEWNSFNQPEILETGVANRLGVFRHVISFGEKSIGKVLLDYQTDTSVARQVRTKTESIFEIKSFKDGVFPLLRPISKFVDWRFEKTIEKVEKIKSREDDNIHQARLDYKAEKWLFWKNFFRKYSRRILKINVLNGDGEVYKKVKLAVPIENIRRYNGIAFQPVEREISKENEHFVQQFEGFNMKMNEMSDIKSPQLSKMYLHNDKYIDLIKDDNYKFLKKEQEQEVDENESEETENVVKTKKEDSKQKQEEYSVEARIEYYKTRVNDLSLTDSQRNYAKRRLESLENGGE